MDENIFPKDDYQLLVQKVEGGRNFSNLILFIIIFGLGFLLIFLGLFSFPNIDNIFSLPFRYYSYIPFFPQGILMLIFGLLSIFYSLYIFLLLILDIGGGFNEFDCGEGIIRIMRRGFPWQNRNLLFTYPIEDLDYVEFTINEGLDTIRNLYLVTNDLRRIPLSSLSESLSIKEAETDARLLANFLGLPCRFLFYDLF